MKRKRSPSEIDAWNVYWGTKRPDSGCIPGAPDSVAELLQRTWQDFFNSLPQEAELLDLGTGSGAVLRLAQILRPELRLTGVDYASSLPDLGNSVRMHSSVLLEDLPFGDSRFDVVTSQFALEYGVWPAAVEEMSRVLAKNGYFLLICHHGESIIVAANRDRVATIDLILGGSGLISGALKIVRQRKTKEPKSHRHLDRLLNKLHDHGPDQQVVLEVVRQVAAALTEPDALKRLLALRRDIEMERIRIKALLAAALSADRARELQRRLTSCGAVVQMNVLFLPATDIPLAWCLSNSSIA